MNNTGFLGNADIKTAVSRMIKNKKLTHSFVITGDKGLGKKTAARYIGAAILCENNSDGTPCMKCKSCKMISHGGHPDFIEIKPSGKSGGYILDKDLRPIVSEAYVKPNESEYKVVVISDMDATQQNSQNALLKVVEEPPAHMVIIMTACSREYFLPTILSRVTHFKVYPLDKEELKNVVMGKCESFDGEKFEKAYEAMGGNVGKCVEFIDGKQLSTAVSLTGKICSCIYNMDEYALMQAFYKAGEDKKLFVEVLMLLSNVLRDCAVKRSGGSSLTMLSCCKEETLQLALKISPRKAILLYELCEKYISRINSNANIGLAHSAICAEIMEII
ncbi:MAG: hypothetical protein E7509_06990 [Ruminococcus sp.]|nr:hypothetical protein [Ruminococcus sp.]